MKIPKNKATFNAKINWEEQIKKISGASLVISKHKGLAFNGQVAVHTDAQPAAEHNRRGEKNAAF